MTAVSTDLRLAPSLTPHGRLLLVLSDDTPALDPACAGRIRQAFDRGAGHGLLQLGAGEVGQALPPVFAYWRELGARYVTALCTRPGCRRTPRGAPAAARGRAASRWPPPRRR